MEEVDQLRIVEQDVPPLNVELRFLHNLPKIVRVEYWDGVEVFEDFEGAGAQ